MRYAELQNYVGGTFVTADLPFLDVYNPSSGDVISRVPLSAAREVDMAVQCAKAAFPKWSQTPIKERVQVFYRYKALLEKHIDELAALVTEENGKIASEARAEILKSAELTEFACSLPQITPGHEIGGRDRGLGARGRVLERQRSLRACLSGDSNAHPDGEKTTYLHGTVSEV